MTQLLWAFLPDEAIPLLVAGIGLLAIVGLLRGRRLASVLLPVLLLPIVSPFVESAVATLPGWVSLALIAIIVLSLARAAASVLLGRRAAEHMVGILAADLVRSALSLLFLPIRLAFRVGRSLSDGDRR